MGVQDASDISLNPLVDELRSLWQAAIPFYGSLTGTDSGELRCSKGRGVTRFR